MTAKRISPKVRAQMQILARDHVDAMVRELRANVRTLYLLMNYSANVEYDADLLDDMRASAVKKVRELADEAFRANRELSVGVQQ
jgi:hypothetical protein